ncbi:DUF6962 family protein [Actinomadura luteofluorescens]|uniref:DUF6962 family protein n=1 Tax=Actinomadura luteofluorescens TaxID=46163 RepID=UPI00363E378A
MLAEPAPALSDLALGLVVVALAVRLGRTPAPHRHWRTAFWWAGAAALAAPSTTAWSSTRRNGRGRAGP